MKRILICFFAMAHCYLLTAQRVGIGNPNPHSSAILDLTSIDKGLIIPRMTGAQRVAIPNPVAGMIVYQTNNESASSTYGYYMHYGGGAPGGWRRMARADEIIAGATTWTVNGINQYSNVEGNVGIGTINPTSKLSVTGNLVVSDGNIGINDPNGTLFFRVSGSAKASMAMGGINDDLSIGTLAFNDLGKLYFKTQSVDRMTILPNGNVGVGFVNPSYKLDVNGHTRTVGNLIAEDGYIQIKNTTDSKLWNMQYSSGSGRLLFLEQGVERLILQNGGNVGIGKALPGGKLHVNGNTIIDGDAILNTINPTIQLQNNAVDKGFVQLSGDNIRIGTNSGNTNGKFVIRTNGGDRFFVDANGNVNIGTQTDAPGYLLRVDGRMICEEVKVKLSTAWPDYVFNDHHALMSINQLSTFIRTNKHLPNIPSAKEVEKNGIEIGDMQKRMMEKIEELTLYIIQQQNEIDALKILIKSNK